MIQFNLRVLNLNLVGFRRDYRSGLRGGGAEDPVQKEKRELLRAAGESRTRRGYGVIIVPPEQKSI